MAEIEARFDSAPPTDNLPRVRLRARRSTPLREVAQTLFPRTQPFAFNAGGYVTLSFIPTLGTTILGLFAAQWLRAGAPRIPMRRLLAAGVIGIAAGLFFHFTGICPVVKRIWTPSWTLFSGGICFLFLAA